LRALLWSYSSLQAVRHCGRVPRSVAQGVTVRASEGVAGFAGLQHCGSVWSDPVCSSSILTHRALDIGAVLGQAVAEGFTLGFGTLTMRHHRSQPLKALWDAAGKAWGRATAGKQWVTVQDRHGVVGWVRVWEVTDGRNGWHVHVHFVVVLAAGATAADFDSVAGGMFDRWSRGLVGAGQEAPRLVGQEWHIVGGDEASGQLAEYLFKLVEQGDVRAAQARSLGLELAHTQPGRARAELATRPVWALVQEVAESGDADALDRWHEWERGSKGRRQVGWSKGLRARFQPATVEATDDEIVDQEHGSSADDVAVITRDGWARLVQIREGCTDVLDALEVGGVTAMVDVLDGHGIEHYLVIR
jgi:hypothetical protein